MSHRGQTNAVAYEEKKTMIKAMTKPPTDKDDFHKLYRLGKSFSHGFAQDINRHTYTVENVPRLPTTHTAVPTL